MSTESAPARRDPLPALTLGRALPLEPPARKLDPEMIGGSEVASGTRRRALVEPSLLLRIRRRLAITCDERKHAEDAIDLVEDMPQGALRLRTDRSGVEHAIDVAQPREHDAHRLRQVEVVVHRLVETDAHAAHRREDGLVASAPLLLDGPQPGNPRLEVDESLHRHVAVGEQVVRVLERLAIVGARGKQITQRRRARALVEHVAHSGEVTHSFGHLLAAHAQVLAVTPDAHEALTCGRLGLGDLVLMVRKDVVDATAVNVEALTEQGHAHGRAFDVPAGSSPADACVPADLVRAHSFPEREIADVFLGVVVGVDPSAGAGHEPFGIRAAEPAVCRECRDVEVVAAVGAIRRAGAPEALDEVDHLLDVLGGARIAVRGADAERVAILLERGDPLRGLLVEGVPVGDGVLDDPVVDVGEIHHVRDVAGEPPVQPAAQDILEDEGPEVADVDAVPDRGAAGVHADVAGLDRLHRDELTTHRVVQLDGHRRSSSSVADAAIPSLLPENPMPSVVVAPTAIVPGSRSSAVDIASDIDSRCAASRGSSAIAMTWALMTVQPSVRSFSATTLRNSQPDVSFHWGSLDGKCLPMSPSPAAPRIASTRACTTASPSECPSNPR